MIRRTADSGAAGGERILRRILTLKLTPKLKLPTVVVTQFQRRKARAKSHASRDILKLSHNFARCSRSKGKYHEKIVRLRTVRTAPAVKKILVTYPFFSFRQV